MIKAKATSDNHQVWAYEDAYGVKLFTRRCGTTKSTDAVQGLFERAQETSAAEDRVCDYLDKSEKLDISDFNIPANGTHLAMGLIAVAVPEYQYVGIAGQEVNNRHPFQYR